MAENLLKINEKEGEIFMLLNDKQAGELIKALCAYQFNNGTPESYIRDDRVGGLFVIFYGSIQRKTPRNTNVLRGEEERTGKFKIRRKKN